MILSSLRANASSAARAPGATRKENGPSVYIWAVLSLSALLRLWLAMAGGQNWWPDEDRFTHVLAVADLALGGRPAEALAQLFSAADHIGFKVIALLPALAVKAGAPLWVPAAFFGLFSSLSLLLIWRLARFMSGSREVADWSVFLGASSLSLFYFSRHLLPYDLALFFGLSSMAVGIRDGRARTAWAAGLLAGVGFLVYNGYWLFCGVALFLAVSVRAQSVVEWIRRSVCALAGLLLAIGVSVACGIIWGKGFVQSGVAFAKTVNYGDFNEGWSLPWKYLWSAEGAMLVVWAIGAVLGLWVQSFRRNVLVWLGGATLVGCALGLMSAQLEWFVVYGRTARCLVPFFVLASAPGLAALAHFEPHGRRVQVCVAAVVVLLAGFSFAGPLRQWFPPDFVTCGQQVAARHPVERIRITNGYSLYRPTFLAATPYAEVLFAAHHPLQYEPFLFENLRRDQRQMFRTHDLTMRVLRLKPDAPGRLHVPESRFAPYPGPVRMTLRLPKKGDRHAPIIATGTARQSTLVSVLRVEPNLYRFRVIDWGHWLIESGPLRLSEDEPHEVVISLGSLVPPAGAHVYEDHPELHAFRGRLYLAVDGRDVFNEWREFNPATPTQIDVGFNLFNAGTSEVYFGGRFERIVAAEPEMMLQRFRGR